MPQNPKDSWQAITTLKGGILGHHISPDIMRFANEDGTFSTSDEEVVKLLSKYFHDVYNRNVSIHWSVLEELKNKPTLKQLNDPLTRLDFNRAIKKIIIHKAPGLNGVSPNAIKALYDENRNVLFGICYDFFDGNVEIEERQIGNLKILPKKGDTSNPNNWRGINLLDSKLFWKNIELPYNSERPLN